MQIYYKEKALLVNQYKIEKAERTKNWVGRNRVKVLLFGIFISLIGPVYTHQPDGVYRTKAVNALDYSDFGYTGTAITFFVFYIFCMTIAYFVWKYQDEKKIRMLKAHRIKLEEELQLLRNQK